MPKILILDDEQPLLHSLSSALTRLGHECILASTGREAEQHLESHSFDLAIVDVQLPDVSGLEILRKLRAEIPEAPVLVITAYASVDTAVEAMKEGAIDYIEKPLDLEELGLVVERELANARARTEVEAYRRDQGTREAALEILGVSEPIKRLRQLVEQICEVPIERAGELPTILIEGETGTGKGLIVRSIHHRGRLSERPLVHVNCAGLPRELVESELFGHEKGAFTGADTRKQGLFEVARGGTIFLDEIGHMPLELQSKLLTAIESKRFRRVGGTREHEIDAWIMAATNSDLTEGIESGRFRSDLYYRLRVVHVQVPPLRERREDISVLAQHFFRRHQYRYRREDLCLDEASLRSLQSWSWPGNVRELDYTLERMVITAKDGQLGPLGHLGHLGQAPAAFPGRLEFDFASGECTLESVERRLLEAALDHCGRNITQAARLLGLTRGGLRHKLQKLGILDNEEGDSPD